MFVRFFRTPCCAIWLLLLIVMCLKTELVWYRFIVNRREEVGALAKYRFNLLLSIYYYVQPQGKLEGFVLTKHKIETILSI